MRAVTEKADVDENILSRKVGKTESGAISYTAGVAIILEPIRSTVDDIDRYKIFNFGKDESGYKQ